MKSKCATPELVMRDVLLFLMENRRDQEEVGVYRPGICAGALQEEGIHWL